MGLDRGDILANDKTSILCSDGSRNNSVLHFDLHQDQFYQSVVELTEGASSSRCVSSDVFQFEHMILKVF